MTAEPILSLWMDHKDGLRPIGNIVAEACLGTLPGVQLPTKGPGFRVVDETAALAAMRKEMQS